MEIVVIFFLAFSLLFYCLFGGADFGAGILEFFSRNRFREKSEELTNKAIGPVWEANHMWLIIMVVILFMAFPRIYSAVSTSLHIPVTAIVLGIVLRGSFFTFRHYDLIHDNSERVYSHVFSFSSVFTAFFIGVTAGALKAGRIDTTAADFYSGYITSWFNLFCFTVGLFVCALFAFLAAVYLIGETKESHIPKYLVTQALRANLAIVFFGTLVFVAAEINQINLLSKFLSDPLSLLALFIASGLLVFLWNAIKRRKVIISRLLAGAQVFLILFAWLWEDFPEVVSLKNEPSLSLVNSMAPHATVTALGWALLIGSVLILPSLGYLLITFKREDAVRNT